MDVIKRSSFSVNGTWVKEVYRVKGAVAHRGRSMRSMIAFALFSMFSGSMLKAACGCSVISYYYYLPVKK